MASRGWKAKAPWRNKPEFLTVRSRVFYLKSPLTPYFGLMSHSMGAYLISVQRALHQALGSHIRHLRRRRRLDTAETLRLADVCNSNFLQLRAAYYTWKTLWHLISAFSHIVGEEVHFSIIGHCRQQSRSMIEGKLCSSDKRITITVQEWWKIHIR